MEKTKVKNYQYVLYFTQKNQLYHYWSQRLGRELPLGVLIDSVNAHNQAS